MQPSGAGVKNTDGEGCKKKADRHQQEQEQEQDKHAQMHGSRCLPPRAGRACATRAELTLAHAQPQLVSARQCAAHVTRRLS